MFPYQLPAFWADGAPGTEEKTPSVANVPQIVWVPVLVPFWEQPHPHYEEESIQRASPTDSTLPRSSCDASADNTDSHSDASTDVGDDDDIVDDFEEEAVVNLVEDPQPVPGADTPGRPCLFAKLTRQQRVEQLRRVIDEFCDLEFDSVDASSQAALVLRMLTILKSLGETTTFHGEQGRSSEKRLFLLGLGSGDEDAIKDVVHRAEELCEGRSFRAAFDVLQEVAPRLRGESAPCSKQASTVEIEAMKLRRLEKRQRQREERRVQRATERVGRSAQRCKRAPQQPSNAGASSSSAWRPPRDTGPKRSSFFS